MPMVSSSQLARSLKLESKRRVEQLVHEGMPRASRGQYDREACMEWYIGFLASRKNNGNGHHGDEATLNEARLRIVRAEASMKEIDLEKKRGELLRVTDAEAMWQEGMARLRSNMLASISSNARKVIGLKTVAEAHAALERIVYDALEAGASVGDELTNGSGGADS